MKILYTKKSKNLYQKKVQELKDNIESQFDQYQFMDLIDDGLYGPIVKVLEKRNDDR